jgi:hypothetical protein
MLKEQDQHDVGISVVPELLEPADDVLISVVLRDIVHQERADCPSVIPGTFERKPSKPTLAYAEVMAR